MEKYNLGNLACRISAINIFRNILKKPQMDAFVNFLKCEGDVCKKLSIYGEFVHSLADYDNSFSKFLIDAVCTDENLFVISCAKGKEVPESVLKNVQAELKLFSELSKTDAEILCNFDYSGYIPVFENEETDFEAMYEQRMENIEKYGYGIFATAGMFKLENNEIVAVEAADEIALDRFVGYADERQKIVENTRMLVEGRPAANALLCGDAGTGKSSTVKAVANYFFDQGVRLIEIRKDQLFQLSYVMGRIDGNPLKFIIFIDDLSFNKNDDCFSMLKAVLEGSASAKSSNAVIYATSNRRHIIKETFADRSSTDELHRNDTMQELLSLSERFGLTVYFEKPSKSLYLDIIHKLAYRHGIEATDDLDVKAEAFALARGSRSPRAAEHFIKSLL